MYVCIYVLCMFVCMFGGLSRTDWIEFLCKDGQNVYMNEQ